MAGHKITSYIMAQIDLIFHSFFESIVVNDIGHFPHNSTCQGLGGDFQEKILLTLTTVCTYNVFIRIVPILSEQSLILLNH